MAWFRTSGNNGGSLKVLTASGDIASFETNLPEPLQSVIVDIEATGGNGSPDNPISINGYSSANITRCGVNLWDEVWEEGTYNTTTGQPVSYDQYWRNTNPIRIKGGQSYYIKTSGDNFYLFFYDVNGDYLTFQSSLIDSVITMPSDACFLNIVDVSRNVYDSATKPACVNYPSTDTTYHAYNGQTYTIAFGQTVYGGQLIILPDRTYFHATNTIKDLGDLTWAMGNRNTDNTGYVFYTPNNILTPSVKLLSNLKSDIFKQYSNYNASWEATTVNNIRLGSPNVTSIVACADYNSKDDFVSAVTGHKVVYELATPFDIDLTPVQIEALVGVNNVWHDGNGDTEVKYLEVVRN